MLIIKKDEILLSVRDNMCEDCGWFSKLTTSGSAEFTLSFAEVLTNRLRKVGTMKDER